MIGTLEMKDAVLKRRAVTKRINSLWSNLYSEEGFCLRKYQVREWRALATEDNRLALVDAIESADADDIADLLIAFAQWMDDDMSVKNRDYLADKMGKLLTAVYDLEREIEEL